MTNIQQRHDNAENWITANPVLLEGEIGFETDTNKFKFGNGINDYNSLPYASTTDNGGLEIGDIGTALYIDETKGKRRWLNGSILAINENTQGFVNWLKKAVQSVPSLATTETNWQAEATLSAYGQCGKFVIDEEAGTIRLPKVVNIRGLQDLTKAGATVAAGLPSLSLNEAGNHAHTRGTMEISGDIPEFASATTTAGSNGVFNWSHRKGNIQQGSVFNHLSVNFYASRNWTGETSYNGQHTHSSNNSIYGKSTTVQPEAIQYPYFIQIATGSETKVNIVNEIELNNPFYFGMSQYFETEPNNISWLKSNGQWNSKAVYSDYYNWIFANFNDEKDGFKNSTDENINDYDFVINTGDETFRLPLKTNSADESISELTLYFYVGETVQNANLIDAGRINEQLPTKLDISTFQANALQKSQQQEITNWGFPSEKYIDLSFGPPLSQYTAPANGWYVLQTVAVNGFGFIHFSGRVHAFAFNNATTIPNNIMVTYPISKGATVILNYNNLDTPNLWRFIYSNGDNQ